MKEATLKITMADGKIDFQLTQNNFEPLEILGAIEIFKIDFQNTQIQKKA